MTTTERRNLRNGLLFISPWIAGFCVFMLYPVVSSLYFSFCDYSVLEAPVWIGTENFTNLFDDKVFGISLGNTFYYAAIALPLGMLVAIALALLLNTKVRGMAVYRTIFFLPSIVPIVAMAILWLWIFNGQYGVLNFALSHLFRLLARGAFMAAPLAVFVTVLLSFLWFAKLSGLGLSRSRILLSSAKLLGAAAVMGALWFALPRLAGLVWRGLFGPAALHSALRWLCTAVSVLLDVGAAVAVLLAAIAASMGGFLAFSLIPGVGVPRRKLSFRSMAFVLAAVLLWLGLLHVAHGLPTFSGEIRSRLLGSPPAWLDSPDWAMPALIIMSLWGVGYSVVIYLAGLQDIPVCLYESADIDGANWWQKSVHITLPMLSPALYFTLIMGIIGALQVFAAPFIMTQGGPERATTFYTYYLFNLAFEDLRMGYACAMGWILFLIILALTLLATKVSQKHVHYER